MAPLWAGRECRPSRRSTASSEPYRTFVAEIADGATEGPPAYGLVPLAELPGGWGDGRPERVLGRPFPLTGTWSWEGDEDTPEEELDEAIEPVFNDGSIVLGTDGCGMYWHLVVTGRHRGHIWLVTGEGAFPFGDAFGGTTATPGFAGWVAHWTANRDWFDAED
ncbi:SMI1/KNR4 family protein [Kitasatospora griseola]|uniref:SMI1/KNR4 family protein n=1 Tax=Kitasatospora griseola TaxID=2064 RepID=UPI00382A593C